MSEKEVKPISDLISDLERKLFDNVHIAIAVVDQERVILRVNQTFCHMFGYSDPSEPVGLPGTILHLSQESYAEFGKQAFDKVLSSDAVSVPYQLRKKDGSVFWVQISGQPINNGQAVLWMMTDITQQKLAEKKLSESEEKFRITFSTSPEPVALSRVEDGVYLDVNERFLELTGYAYDELVGHSSLKVNIWKHQADRQRMVTELIKNGNIENFEAEFLDKSGQVIFGLMSARIVEIDGQKVILTVTRDVSERKQQDALLLARLHLNEAAVHLSQKQLLQKLVDEAELLTHSKIGFLHFVNEDQDHLFLQVWSTATLQHFCVADPGENHYPISKAGVWVDCVRQKAPVIHNDYLGLPHRKGLPEGHAPIVRDLVIPLFDKDRIFAILGVGNKDSLYNQRDVRLLTAFGLMAWDIIARKGSEEQRKELELQLRQKYKMEAVGVMAGGIAHNFNNNLAIILGNLEMAVRKQADPEALAKYLNNARIAVLRSRDLVAQILTYSHQGRKELGAVDICIVINETLNLLKSTLPASIRLLHLSSSQSLIVNADPGQIQEALINLCNNAVCAMNEKGTLKIALERVELQACDIPARCSSGAGAYAKLAVEDSGCGIEKDIIDRIFDPFFTTKGIDRGTGMGLSTVQGIVDQHGGFIAVESSVGEGSVFYLYFPLEEQRFADRPNLQEEEKPQGGSERVLLVDDDLNLLALVEQMLVELGYRVTTAPGSHEALELFLREPTAFDLLITDQTMPVMTGESLVRKIRSIRGDLPVILITGYSSKINRAESQALGIDAFCMKPLGMTELAKVVRKVLSEASLRR